LAVFKISPFSSNSRIVSPTQIILSKEHKHRLNLKQVVLLQVDRSYHFRFPSLFYTFSSRNMIENSSNGMITEAGCY
jgi:hypothetical protein